MKQFEYLRPATLDEAVQLAAEREDARLLAGGTNLVDLMKLGVEQPGLLIDLRPVLETDITARPDGGVRIGAGASNSDVAAAALVRERYPAVSEALLSGASGQLRNLATVGGNLLQRTRCAWFQDLAKPCNKRRPGAGCGARGGDARMLAIFGASAACVATHPSDFAVALAALDAEVHVRGPRGSRVVPLRGLHPLPTDSSAPDTVLERGDVVTAVELPPLGSSARSGYRKARDRASFSFALVSVALVIEPGRVRIALGGVAPRPWRASRAEAALSGVELSEASVAEAVALELEGARTLDGNAFKVALARGLIVQAVLELAS